MTSLSVSGQVQFSSWWSLTLLSYFSQSMFSPFGGDEDENGNDGDDDDYSDGDNNGDDYFDADDDDDDIGVFLSK